METNLHQTTPPSASTGPGELVLQNGRQAGTRRPLGMPTTFIGRGPGCDMRLNVDGVDSLHCVLVVSPDGVQLRDLDSVHGTLVNGVRNDNGLLNHGDLLKIGPFQFRLELARSGAPLPTAQSESTEPEIRDSLRIQAAAVAAQQVALEEEEARLQQRRSDLQQQEEQLAAHLAEKQRQVQTWSEHAKAEREVLRKEKLEHEKRLDKLEQDALQTKQQHSLDHHKLTQERQRINNVYQRLKQRWKEQWAAEREKHAKLTKKLHTESVALKERQQSFEARETAHAHEVLRFNTERELGMRQLKEGCDALMKDQELWRRRRSHEFTVLKGMQRRADETQVKLKQARQILVDEKNVWDKQLASLQKELHGLNNRIVHQRQRVQEQTDEIARLDTLLRDKQKQLEEEPILALAVEVADAEEPPLACEYVEVDSHIETTSTPPDDWQRRCDALDRLASDLADQRVHLLEQYERLAAIQDDWQRRRDAAAAELDQLGQRLVAQELALGVRAEQTSAAEASILQRQQEIETLRQEIQIWRAQLKAREQLCEQEHERQLLALRQKETLLQDQLTGLAQLRHRWNQRRQQESEQARSIRAALNDEKNQSHQQRVALFEKRQQLEEDKRILAEKSLALEQYRQEVFLRANDPAAQRRVERLRRQWLTLNAGLIRNSKSEREATKKEMTQIETERVELQKLRSQLTGNEITLAEKQCALEEREIVLKARLLTVDQELHKLQNERQQSEQQSLRLQEEVDTLAKAVYDEPAIDQAA